MKKIFELFTAFAGMGAVCFGGGYAMLPLLEREIVQKRGWATQDEIIDYYAIGQCTPGVIAVNVSTFIGYKRSGIAGAIASTSGMLFFPFIIITIIAGLLKNFADNFYVQRAFSGIAVCVCVLIINAVLTLWKKSVRNGFGYVVYMVVLLLAMITDISSVFFVLASGFAGIVYFGIKNAKKAEEAEK